MLINLNEYIYEKLHLNKDIKISDLSLLDKVEDVLINYLKRNNWFDTNHYDWEITKKEDTGNKNLYVFLKYPKELPNKIDYKLDSFRFNLTVEINKKLKVDWYSTVHKDDNKIEFSDNII